MTRSLFLPLLVVLFALSGAGTLPASAQDEPRVGQVMQVVGTVTVLRAGGPGTLAIGQPVYRSDRIFTASDSRIRIGFADGSVLTIGTDSEVLIADFVVDGRGNRLRSVLTLILGIVRATVATPAANASFDVRTRDAVASARSTEWVVEAKEAGSAVFVIGGRVEVSGLAGGSVLLEATYGSDVPQGGQPKAAKRWGMARVRDVLARTRLP